MQIKIKLQGSQLIGIDIYEVADSSLEATLKAILGTYEPRLSTRSSATVLSVPVPIEIDEVESTDDLVPVQGLDRMSKVEWEYAMVAFQREGDLTEFTTWLDKVFRTTTFSAAKTVYAIASKAPQISRLDYARWVQLVENLVNLGCLRPVNANTLRAYYNMALRLDE